MCEKVYQNEDVESIPVYITVNVFLYYLFQEYSEAEDEMASNYRQHSERCQSNIQTGFKALSLMLPPLQENIVALLLGVMSPDPKRHFEKLTKRHNSRLLTP